MIRLLALALLFVLAGCSSAVNRAMIYDTGTMYGAPPTVSTAAIPRVWAWAGVPFTVEDARRLPDTMLLGSGTEDRLWKAFSARILEETRRVMGEALGPERADTRPRNLVITILDYRVIQGLRWAGSDWGYVGISSIRAQARRADVVEQEWTGEARISQVNWIGPTDARAALKDSYEAALLDLLRKMAEHEATPPPRTG